MATFCGFDEPTPDDLPDTGGTCCYGAGVFGSQRCTCWRPVCAEPVQTGDLNGDSRPVVRSGGMCGDCAYRPGSPEKAGDPGYRGDADDLEDLATSGTPFYCHDGMRRVAKWVHPSGAEVAAKDGAYAPPFHGDIPHRVDGEPAYLCAGWNARRRALSGKDGHQLTDAEVDARRCGTCGCFCMGLDQDTNAWCRCLCEECDCAQRAYEESEG